MRLGTSSIQVEQTPEQNPASSLGIGLLLLLFGCCFCGMCSDSEDTGERKSTTSSPPPTPKKPTISPETRLEQARALIKEGEIVKAHRKLERLGGHVPEEVWQELTARTVADFEAHTKKGINSGMQRVLILLAQRTPESFAQIKDKELKALKRSAKKIPKSKIHAWMHLKTQTTRADHLLRMFPEPAFKEMFAKLEKRTNAISLPPGVMGRPRSYLQLAHPELTPKGEHYQVPLSPTLLGHLLMKKDRVVALHLTVKSRTGNAPLGPNTVKSFLKTWANIEVKDAWFERDTGWIKHVRKKVKGKRLELGFYDQTLQEVTYGRVPWKKH